MHWIYSICFALLSTGLLALFGVRPRDFTDTIFNIRRKIPTLTDELDVLIGKPTRGFFTQDYEIRQILKDMGREDRYEAVTRLTLLLFAVGAVLALLINNVYMVPILGLLVIGALIAALAAVVVGKVLKWDPWLSAAVGVTCLLGYPFTYGIAMEAVNGNTFGKNFSEEEVQRLTNYVLPKMVIGGVVSVSIVSVIIAAYIGPMIFG